MITHVVELWCEKSGERVQICMALATHGDWTRYDTLISSSITTWLRYACRRVVWASFFKRSADVHHPTPYMAHSPKHDPHVKNGR